MITVYGGPDRWLGAAKWLVDRGADFQMVIWEGTGPQNDYRTFKWDEPYLGVTFGQHLEELVTYKRIFSKSLDFLIDDEETAILFKLRWGGDGTD